ncbi:S8 family serine peptidase [bacterium]|nr:S8 family serine peptidase [bacterium]
MKKRAFALLFLISSLTLLADPGVIRLRDNTIDPNDPAIQSTAELKCCPTASGRYQYMVQPKKNFNFTELKTVESLGVKITGFFPPNAYLALAAPDEISNLKTQFEIIYIGEYLPEYKIGSCQSAKIAAMGQPFKAAIILSSKEEYPEVKDLLLENGATDCQIIHSDPFIMEAMITRELAHRLAKLSAVIDIAEKGALLVNNDVAKGDNLMNVEKVNKTGYTGKGVKVAVVDTGLDSGNPNSNFHPDFQDKDVTIVKSSGSDLYWGYDISGHGTHVTGSAVGTGAVENGKYAGTAPDASLYFIAIGCQDYSLCYVKDEEIKAAYDAGSRIMNNSWSDADYTGSYNWKTVWFDRLAHDYDDMLIVFSAGNANDDIATEDNINIHSFAACKNVLVVAAAESYRPDRTETYGSERLTANDFFKDDKMAYPSDGVHQGMACFSGRGPCSDGRIKPDIAAPGTLVCSTESIMDSYNDWERKRYYTYMSGTSMAAPLAAGACADILQYLKESGVKDPSSALIKAVALNGARSMGTGQYEGYREIPNVTPNSVNGYGHIDLIESINPACGKLFTMEGTLTNSGDTVSFPCSKSTAGPVRVTLCWNDCPGTTSAMSALVNDLDLTISDSKNTYYAGGAAKKSDSENNVEQIWIKDFPTGENIEISVKGYNIMEGPQRFAVAISGVDEAVPEPTFTFAILILALLLGRKTR